MIWFFIEMGVALLLLVLIVWWTIPRRDGARGDNEDTKDLGSENPRPEDRPPGD